MPSTFPRSLWSSLPRAGKLCSLSAETPGSPWLRLTYVCMLFVFTCPPQVLLKRGLRKKKRAVDVDVLTRFSLLNISIIAHKKRKVKSFYVIQ